jgi:hypothetical protein
MPKSAIAALEDRAPGLAALAICEALILALVEAKTLSADQAGGLLCDAEAAYRFAHSGRQKPLHDGRHRGRSQISASRRAFPHQRVRKPEWQWPLNHAPAST